MKKDVIYIDVDDEITSITDKINNTKSNIVALVLPKKCNVLKSSVNMKILKKEADAIDKKIVLITSESSLLPIAAIAGIHVAKTLQSKPELHKAPEAGKIESINEGEDEIPELDSKKSIGELARAMSFEEPDDESTIELDDEDEDGSSKSKKTKKGRRLKVPNFDKFRLRLLLAAVGVISLVGLWILGAVVLPKAKVIVYTNNKTTTVNLEVVADPAAKELDLDQKIVPLSTKTIEQVETKKFVATGEKNIGEKASGSVILYNCSVDDKLSDTVRTISAGTGISYSKYTFILQKEVTVQPSGFNGATCKMDKPTEAVAVVAQIAGDDYNLSARTYAVSGFSTMRAVDKNGMGGGTDKLVTSVSQSDCDDAKNSLLNTQMEDAQNQLVAQLSADGLVAVRESYSSKTGEVSCSPKVGEEASESTASITFTLSMTGMDETALSQLVENKAAAELEGSTLSIVDSGVKNALVTIKERKANGVLVVAVQADVETGFKQNADELIANIAGKKSGDSIDYIKSLSGVSDAKIHYSPFWVRKMPSNLQKITIEFENVK